MVLFIEVNVELKKKKEFQKICLPSIFSTCSRSVSISGTSTRKGTGGLVFLTTITVTITITETIKCLLNYGNNQ